MQLAEHWPYALILFSGAALGVVLFLLLRPSARPVRRVAARRPSEAGAGVRRFSAVAPRNAGPRSRIPGEPPAGAGATPPAGGGPTPVRPAMPLREAGGPRAGRRDRQSGDFLAAARSEGREDPRGELDFDIPSFLLREAEPARGMPGAAAEIEDGRRLAGGLGRLVYEPPRRLRQFAPVLVAVRIQPEGGYGSPASAYSAASERERHAERTLLAVQLIALDGAAQIVSRAPLIQRSGPGETGLEWHFEITALRSGRIRFELVVTAARQDTSEIDEAARIASAVIARPDWRSPIRRVAALFAAATFIVLVTWVAARLF